VKRRIGSGVASEADVERDEARGVQVQTDSQSQFGMWAAAHRHQDATGRGRKRPAHQSHITNRMGQHIAGCQVKRSQMPTPFHHEQVRLFGSDDLLQVTPGSVRHHYLRAGAHFLAVG